MYQWELLQSGWEQDNMQELTLCGDFSGSGKGTSDSAFNPRGGCPLRMVLQIAEVPSDPIQKGCRAFTLLELLMASAAFAMIVLVMKVTLMGSLSLHQPKSERMDALNLRMRVMDIMEKDLRQCLLKETPFAQEFLGDSQGQG